MICVQELVGYFEQLRLIYGNVLEIINDQRTMMETNKPNFGVSWAPVGKLMRLFNPRGRTGTRKVSKLCPSTDGWSLFDKYVLLPSRGLNKAGDNVYYLDCLVNILAALMCGLGELCYDDFSTTGKIPEKQHYDITCRSQLTGSLFTYLQVSRRTIRSL